MSNIETKNFFLGKRGDIFSLLSIFSTNYAFRLHHEFLIYLINTLDMFTFFSPFFIYLFFLSKIFIICSSPFTYHVSTVKARGTEELSWVKFERSDELA